MQLEVDPTWGVSETTEAKRIVTIDELDKAVVNVVKARQDYEDKKEISNEASRQVDVAESLLIELLQAAGKTSYKVDGVGSVVAYDKYAVRNPEDAESRRKFFAWIEEKYGQDGLDKFQVTNYASINSLFNQHSEECALTGEDPSIPGLGLPTATKTLRLTKAK